MFEDAQVGNWCLQSFLLRMENVTPQWKEEMKSITTTVQAAVKAIYGGKLKMLSSWH